MTQVQIFERKTTDWLSRHVGQTLTFRFGSMEYTSELRRSSEMNIYFFRVDGSEFDARICEIFY